MQAPRDGDGHYTIVYSRMADRPANTTRENGVAWIEWSLRGAGISGPKATRWMRFVPHRVLRLYMAQAVPGAD